MNLLEHLDIQIKQTSPEQVELSLIVREIHKQPFGIMHGGMNGVLIETACSLGANQNVAQKRILRRCRFTSQSSTGSIDGRTKHHRYAR